MQNFSSLSLTCYEQSRKIRQGVAPSPRPGRVDTYLTIHVVFPDFSSRISHIIRLGCSRETQRYHFGRPIFIMWQIISKNVTWPQLARFDPTLGQVHSTKKNLVAYCYIFQGTEAHKWWDEADISSIFGIGAIWIFSHRLSITKSWPPADLRSAM